jgi:hypothetical protein
LKMPKIKPSSLAHRAAQGLLSNAETDKRASKARAKAENFNPPYQSPIGGGKPKSVGAPTLQRPVTSGAIGRNLPKFNSHQEAESWAGGAGHHYQLSGRKHKADQGAYYISRGLKKSGQDSAILGVTSGRAGGHAGRGLQPTYGV